MANDPLSILCFGAHPDDCDFRCAGLALKYRALGHRVTFVSMTNGDGGHQDMGGGPLARRRYAETQASARIADIDYLVLDVHDGELEPSVALRHEVIRIMRRVEADLVLCHRPNDYHPDHRAVGVLVQDAAYTVTVPNVAALTPHLERAPVVGYMFDRFTLPAPFRAHVAVDTDDVLEKMVAMGACHESQVFEWLPFNGGTLDQVPGGEAERQAWFAARHTRRVEGVADACRDALVALYGAERGARIRTAEAIMISEYGRGLPPSRYRDLFPFLPEQVG